MVNGKETIYLFTRGEFEKGRSETLILPWSGILFADVQRGTVSERYLFSLALQDTADEKHLQTKAQYGGL